MSCNTKAMLHHAGWNKIFKMTKERKQIEHTGYIWSNSPWTNSRYLQRRENKNCLIKWWLWLHKTRLLLSNQKHKTRMDEIQCGFMLDMKRKFIGGKSWKSMTLGAIFTPIRPVRVFLGAVGTPQNSPWGRRPLSTTVSDGFSSS